MKEVSFEKYQDKVINLLRDVNKIFDEENLICWAHSGTLLGIIRHDEKIIPWDDDIDIMVSYKDWILKRKTITEKMHDKNFIIIDYINDDKNIPSAMKFVRIFSNEEYKVKGFERETISRPFVDVFFAVPADSFNSEIGWWWYESMWKSYWISWKGFNRYQKAFNNKTKQFWKNLLTFPLKIFFQRKIMHNYLFKPFNINKGDWSKLRRADAWSSRKVVYDINNGLMNKNINNVKIVISKDYLNELEQSYGKQWSSSKKQLPHIFSNKHLEINRNVLTKEYIDKILNK